MSAQRIDEVVLVNTEGSHRKAYRVWLEAEGALFHVGFAYGRIGAMLREGRKTTAPVARVTADALHSSGKNTPFLGQRMTGRVMMTLVGGRIVHERRA